MAKLRESEIRTRTILRTEAPSRRLASEFMKVMRPPSGTPLSERSVYPAGVSIWRLHRGVVGSRRAFVPKKVRGGCLPHDHGPLETGLPTPIHGARSATTGPPGVLEKIFTGVRCGVVGRGGEGGYAQFAIASAPTVMPTPPGMELDVAASLMVAGATAMLLVHDVGRLESEETIMVPAAAGGLGSLVVQLAKLQGARVMAVLRTRTSARGRGGGSADRGHRRWTARRRRSRRAAAARSGSRPRLARGSQDHRQAHPRRMELKTMLSALLVYETPADRRRRAAKGPPQGQVDDSSRSTDA